MRYHEQQWAKTPVPDDIRSKKRVAAIPDNLHPEYNEGRRKPRAKALADLHGGDVGTRYVDSAEYVSRRGFAVVVVDAGRSIRVAASTASSTPEEAEEVAIALAIKDPGCSTVLSDSRQAIRKFTRGRVSAITMKILSQTPRRLEMIRLEMRRLEMTPGFRHTHEKCRTPM